MTEQTTVESREAGGTDDLREHRRSIDQREIAARSGLSEAALVAAQVGHNVVRLRTDWQLTLHRLGAVGPVVGLTSNEHATIESVVVYRNIATRGPAAQVSDGDTDLCLFLSEWHTGFALTEERGLGPRRSLQFFDANGSAVHKIFLRENSNVDAFDELVSRQASENQSAGPERRAEPGQRPSNQVQDSASNSDSDLGDREESLPLVHSIDLTQARRFAGPMWSQRVAKASVREVLETAIVSQVPLLIMVGNHGAIQNHAGSIGGLREVDGWLAIHDANFNLHIDEPGIASAWVVGKATPDGVVTSLELYDRAGEMIVYLARL
jgi:putative hemin transport protein